MVGLERTSYTVSGPVGSLEICALVTSPQISCPIEFPFTVGLSVENSAAGMSLILYVALDYRYKQHSCIQPSRQYNFFATGCLCDKNLCLCGDTVEPPKRGHFGNGTFVLSSEVVLFSEVV